MKISVRPSQECDFEPYAHTLLLTLPCEDLDEARENVNIAIERSEKESRELWVAEVETAPVGFMLLEFEAEEKNIEIDWFDVHPDYQRIGVGTTLFHKAEERAKELKYETISMHTAVSNHKMQGFGKKNGFSEEARLPEFWGEKTEDAILLIRRLE